MIKSHKYTETKSLHLIGSNRFNRESYLYNWGKVLLCISDSSASLKYLPFPFGDRVIVLSNNLVNLKVTYLTYLFILFGVLGHSQENYMTAATRWWEETEGPCKRAMDMEPILHLPIHKSHSRGDHISVEYHLAQGFRLKVFEESVCVEVLGSVRAVTEGGVDR